MARRRLAPWEEIPYFLPPRYTTVSPNISGPTWQALVESNPNRVSIILSSPGSAIVSTDTTIAGTEGIQLATGSFTLTFLEKDYGSLVSSAWYLSSQSTTAVTAVEIILREMPGEGT